MRNWQDAEANDELHKALADEVTWAFAKSSNLPEWMQSWALGRNMRPLGELAASAVLPLVIRAEQNGYMTAVRDVLGDGIDTVRTRLASALGKLSELGEVLAELGDCEDYDGDGQNCITAGAEALLADGCLPCRVRAIVEREW